MTWHVARSIERTRWHDNNLDYSTCNGARTSTRKPHTSLGTALALRGKQAPASSAPRYASHALQNSWHFATLSASSRFAHPSRAHSTRRGSAVPCTLAHPVQYSCPSAEEPAGTTPVHPGMAQGAPETRCPPPDCAAEVHVVHIRAPAAYAALAINCWHPNRAHTGLCITAPSLLAHCEHRVPPAARMRSLSRLLHPSLPHMGRDPCGSAGFGAGAVCAGAGTCRACAVGGTKAFLARSCSKVAQEVHVVKPMASRLSATKFLHPGWLHVTRWLWPGAFPAWQDAHLVSPMARARAERKWWHPGTSHCARASWSMAAGVVTAGAEGGAVVGTEGCLAIEQATQRVAPMDRAATEMLFEHPGTWHWPRLAVPAPVGGCRATGAPALLDAAGAGGCEVAALNAGAVCGKGTNAVGLCAATHQEQRDHNPAAHLCPFTQKRGHRA